MSTLVLLLGVVLAIAILSLLSKTKSLPLVLAVLTGALLVLIMAVGLASIRFVGSSQVGIIKKNAFGPSLAGGRIIATGGEMGIQAEVLPPGWHFGYLPLIYQVDNRSLIDIKEGQVGLVEARDGQPLDAGQLFAPEVPGTEFKKMLDDAGYFLTAGGGRKGPQSNVLTPGKYRINTELFNVTMTDATEVTPAAVAVLKSNFGNPPTLDVAPAQGGEPVRLAMQGEKGVLAEPLPPGKYPVNTKAFSVSTVSTKETIVLFTAAQARRDGGVNAEQREITVRTSDGFTFPVDVRIEYRIQPVDAPIIVAKLGSDGDPLLAKLNSTVRAIFRNNAEGVKALDYVNQRSEQERQSLAMLREEMSQVGVTVLAVRIGDVGDEATLGELLKTQRDREIAVQEQITLKEQQKAAEEQKELSRTEQEGEEERRLATASYQVQIAEQEQQQRIIKANAEAEAILIEAEAQANAYQLIATQIGKGNAALIEVLRIVGENKIQITPKVMVTSDGSGSRAAGAQGNPETIALIGTMLDRMVEDEPDAP
ncbi:MAG: hypothetical protein DHS20C14_15420 [Phycisphaeraceae bacterium]|nr:MAG: hypothetical protein DHS20C14_15420 [Phycisphaeraceae bacterium]